MMTAQDDTRAGFTVVNGVIRDPGKFEGSAEYAPYFSDHANDGEVLSMMEDGAYISLVEILSEDLEEFPDSRDLALAKYVLIEESDQGFVSVHLVKDEALADKIRAEHET